MHDVERGADHRRVALEGHDPRHFDAAAAELGDDLVLLLEGVLHEDPVATRLDPHDQRLLQRSPRLGPGHIEQQRFIGKTGSLRHREI